MPELPEVEVARLGITPHVAGQTIERFVIRNAALRWPVDAALVQTLQGARISHTSRRGKYLILHCVCRDNAHGALMIHLGMSGSVRIVAPDAPLQKHDHLDWVLQGCVLRYHDPRRFGSVLWHAESDGDYLLHPRLVGLGLEPFDEAFSGAALWAKLQHKNTAIKQALLAGDIVVGVGNIYASEVLFRCKIHPEMPSKRLSAKQCNLLAEHIKLLLHEAIKQGGSSLKDFVNSDGVSGYFQMFYNVYGRAGEPCTVCKQPIVRIVQGQRATYFCARCQK